MFARRNVSAVVVRHLPAPSDQSCARGRPSSGHARDSVVHLDSVAPTPEKGPSVRQGATAETVTKVGSLSDMILIGPQCWRAQRDSAQQRMAPSYRARHTSEPEVMGTVVLTRMNVDAPELRKWPFCDKVHIARTKLRRSARVWGPVQMAVRRQTRGCKDADSRRGGLRR